MFLATSHGTIVAFDGTQLIQVRAWDDPRVVACSNDGMIRMQTPALAGRFEIGSYPGYVTIQGGGKYAAAIPSSMAIDLDRDAVGPWEQFHLIDFNAEAARFARRVRQLHEAGQPVKIYVGCGPVPRPGFINLDIVLAAPQFFVDHRDDYFIFPFIAAWDIPDQSVDYVFNEDFIEHVSQLMQWQYLAEALRVLKPGGWHRVNTPDVIAAMKRHSHFGQGFAGVYTGEEQWGHVAVLSRMQLKEIAETIGYRDVVFTTRDHGVSPYAEPDFRPGPDRDAITGNIFADLLK